MKRGKNYWKKSSELSWKESDQKALKVCKRWAKLQLKIMQPELKKFLHNQRITYKILPPS